MYDIAICDDDSRFVGYMERMLLKSGLAEDEAAFHEFHSGEELAQACSHCPKVDLLILDMKMDGMDGDEAARLFRSHFPESVLVFCSGACEPTVKSFEAGAYRYLLKAYGDERMEKELQAVIQEMKNRRMAPDIIGTWKQSMVRLRPEEILYISIARGGSKIYADPSVVKYEFESHITSKKKLAELYGQLKGCGFEYAHNSCIVNLRYIKRRIPGELELTDGTRLTVSRSKEKNLREAFARFIAQKY